MSDNIAISGLMLREDHKFVNKQLSLVPTHLRKKLRLEYKDEFISGMNSEPADHRKNNAGRVRANTWLRKKVENPSGRL